MKNDGIISKNKEVAETMNDFFSNAVNKLNIKGYSTKSTSQIKTFEPILNAILKFKEHPSVTKIREKLNVIKKYSFSKTKEEDIMAEIKRLDKKPNHIQQYPSKTDQCYMCSVINLKPNHIQQYLSKTAQ